MTASLGTLHNPSVDAVLDRLAANETEIARRMAAACRAEVAEYAEVRSPAFAAEVLAHSVDHVRAFVRAGRAGRPPERAELEFVRERGAQRARELMPLDALLEAYLVGQRTVWESIVAAAGGTPAGLRTAQALTGLTFGYTHAITVAAADAYLLESRTQASEAERRRRELLDRVLAGHEVGAEERSRAGALGLRAEGDHAVVVAEGDGDGATELIARALTREGRAFVVVRHDEVVAVAPIYVRHGPREIRDALERTATLLERNYGVMMRAGVSSACAGLAELARGYGEARRALRSGGAGAIVALDQLGLLDLLADGADDTARRAVPASAGALLRADPAGTLSATLMAYAECDLNVNRTAERLVVHPNTVHYRLGRVHALTGRDPRRFNQLVELTLALRLADQREAGDGSPAASASKRGTPSPLARS